METFAQSAKETSGTLGAALREGSRFCYKLFIEPRAANEDARQKEFILNIVLCGTLLLFLWTFAIIILSNLGAFEEGAEQYVSILRFLPGPITVVGIFLLSRSGYPRIAAYLVSGTLFAGAAYATMLWGPSLSVVLLSYALAIATSSILVGTRFGFFVTIASIGMIVCFGMQEIASGILPTWKTRGIHYEDITEFSVMLLLIQTLSWLSNREIQKNLARARASESALKEERDMLEVKISDRTAELRRAQAEKMAQMYRFVEFGKLSSGLFHDLMNSLSLVNLQVERLKEEFHPSLPEIQASLRKTVEASRRMEKFIAAIRKQVRVDNFEELFLINDEIQEAMTLFNYKAIRLGILLSFEADESISTYGNPVKFHHMVTNLISNAIDSYEGMKVQRKKKSVTVRLSQKNALVMVSVRDSGSGVSAAIREKIFEPLFTTKAEGQGMGLGLSSTKTAIEKDFGGTISCESGKGGGSIFILSFPLRLG